MIDSTNPRVMADNIRGLSDTQAIQGAELEALGSYSETEIDSGKKWFGETVYRRVLTGVTGDTINAIVTAISTRDMGIANVTYLDIYCKSGDYYAPMGYGFQAYYLYGDSSLAPGVRCLVSREAFLSSPIIAIIEYTKSAPAALNSPAPDDTRSIEPEVREEEPEAEPIEEPVAEVKKTTRKKTTTE